MTVRDYILSQVKKTRDTMRSDSFSDVGGLTVTLRGKTVPSILSILSASANATVEIVDPASVTAAAAEYAEGEIVSASHAFFADDPVVWVDGKIFFSTADGSYCTPDEYNYLKENTLVERAVFGALRSGNSNLTAAFKRLVRISAEASTDKAKEILYLTVGSAQWIDKKKSNKSRIHRSLAPLFTMHIEPVGRGMLAFRATAAGVFFRINTVFRRDLIGQYEADIYEGIPDEPLSAEDLMSALEQVALRAEELLADRIRIDKDAVFLTLLDSQYEAICQKIESNLDSLESSPLARLLAGEKIDVIPGKEGSENPLIYPLAADESQRAVIAASLTGKSVFASAPAGTGKSQTAVNIAANTVLQGGNVFVLSEKLAANDVFLNYSSRIGLDAFCLVVDNAMSIDTLIRAVERVASLPARYIKADLAVDALERYRRSVFAYESLTAKLYRPLAGLGDSSLYDLIAAAASADPLPVKDGADVKKENYVALRSLLSELAVGLFSQMRDEEYRAFFWEGESTEDVELDLLLGEMTERLLEKGLDCKQLLANNHIEREEAVGRLCAQIARSVAESLSEELGLASFGERGVRKMYDELYVASCRMERLYADLVTQTLSARAKEAPTAKLLSLLLDAKKAKIPVNEFFRRNAEALRSVFPIIISTPMPAVNYLYGTGLDRFTLMTVDEASQMPIVAVLPFLDRVERLVVFGDEKQLAIVNTFAKAEKTVSTDYDERIGSAQSSVLDAVRGRESEEGFFAGALRYHYRSKTEMLVHVSNERCYNGSLQVVPDVATSREFLPPYMGLSLIEVADRAHPPLLLRDGENVSEANAIVQDVIRMRKDYPERSVGIITLNEKQQNLILDKLEEVHIEPDRSLWVRSLDNAQGKEADFVFISLAHAARKENGDIRLSVSTFHQGGGKNRLNVLFTRAAYRSAVYISFDYRELLKSDNANIRLLYEYLRYAAEGELNARPAIKAPPADEALVLAVSDLASRLLPAAEGHSRIGSEAVSVDIAVKEKGAERYGLGLLMPASGQSAVAAVTKLAVLKQAEWSLLPLSPTYFLSRPALFASQLEKSLHSEKKTEKQDNFSFLTARRPEKLFTLSDLKDKLYDDSPLESKDFLALHLEEIYRGVLRKELFAMDDKELLRRDVGGDSEARLVYYVRYLPYYIEKNSDLCLNAVNGLYGGRKERRACLLLACLLRHSPDAETPATRDTVALLLKEAKELGIG